MKLPLPLITGLLLSCYNGFSQCPASLTPPAIAGSSTLCAGSTGSLSASGSGDTYTWSPGGANTASISITPTVTTTYSVLMGVSGCTVTAGAAITVTVINTPSVMVSTSSQTVCSLQTFTLSASGASTYLWNTGATNGTISITPPYTTSPQSITQSYTVTGHNACGASSATISVLVHSYPVLNANASNEDICVGEQVILQATSSAPNSFTWTSSAAPQTPISTSSMVVVSPTVNTNYDIVSTYNGSTCYSFIEIPITVNQCTGIAQINGSAGLSVYPNPMSDVLMVELSSGYAADNSFIDVYDAVGKMVIRQGLDTAATMINTSKLPPGIYIYKIHNNNTAVKIGKIVKQ